MANQNVTVFFYGSYINVNVLREADYIPEHSEVARLWGYDIVIQPRANLVRSEQRCVYGILASATHDELARLYTHAKDILGEIYFPEAVMVETLDGKYKPAMCYICPSMEPRPAANDYIDRIVAPARDYGFPDWYIRKIEDFRP